MKHTRNLGNCRRCGADVVTNMDTKEHVIGDAARAGLVRYRHGQKMLAAWTEMWCSE